MGLASAHHRLVGVALIGGLALLTAAACLPERLHDKSLVCEGGECHCAPDRGNCNSDWSDGCEQHLDRSALHCGGCWQVCDHGTCQQGKCICDVAGGWDDCDGKPTNGCETQIGGSKADHCGACGKRCGEGWTCSGGQCIERCLGTTLCGYKCVDLTQDHQHCGACGHSCEAAEVCFASSCVACDELCGVCSSGDLGQAVPVHELVVATTDGLKSSCWVGEVAGAAYSWRAPVAGDYLLSGFGSELDSALSVHTLGDHQCSELACESGAASGGGAAVTVSLLSSEAVQTQVRTSLGSGATQRLHITPAFDAVCPLSWFGWSLPLTDHGNFDGAANLLDASCAPAGGPDIAYKLVAPASGYYLADTAGSVADTVLFARDESCSGNELGCDDDSGGQGAQLVVPLEAGEAIIWVVERKSGSPPGDYLLQVEGPL